MGCLAYMLSDDNVPVVKRVMLACNALYRIGLQVGLGAIKLSSCILDLQIPHKVFGINSELIDLGKVQGRLKTITSPAHFCAIADKTFIFGLSLIFREAFTPALTFSGNVLVL